MKTFICSLDPDVAEQYFLLIDYMVAVSTAIKNPFSLRKNLNLYQRTFMFCLKDIIKCLILLNRVNIGFRKYIAQLLVVSILFAAENWLSQDFASDNRLSPDILLVTTSCHQTFC